MVSDFVDATGADAATAENVSEERPNVVRALRTSERNDENSVKG